MTREELEQAASENHPHYGNQWFLREMIEFGVEQVNKALDEIIAMIEDLDPSGNNAIAEEIRGLKIK